MAWYLVPALKQMIKEANTIAPNRSKGSDGTIGNADHAARDSDHNPEADGSVDAIDLTHDPVGGWDCAHWFEYLRLSKDPRIKYCIFRGKWFRSYAKDGIPAWTLMDYHGKNAHDHHMHVSVMDYLQDSTLVWFSAQTTGALAMDAKQWAQHMEWTGMTHKALDEIKAGQAKTNELLQKLVDKPGGVGGALPTKEEYAQAVVAEMKKPGN